MTTWAGRFGVGGTLSLAIILIAFGATLFAPAVVPYPAQGAGEPNIVARLSAPSAAHWLGTDALGRDLLSRIVYGARVSVTIGVTVVVVAMVIGMAVGTVAGYFGGWIDELLMRTTDIFLAIPALLLAVLLAAALGAGLWNCIIAISISWWPWYARLARSEVVVLRGLPYVEAAELMGVSHAVILWRHILPTVVRPVGVQGALDFGPALLTGSALSFLGLGVSPPAADWGNMVNVGRALFPERWWLAVFPGLAIFILALAFSIFGEALREAVSRRSDAG